MTNFSVLPRSVSAHRIGLTAFCAAIVFLAACGGGGGGGGGGPAAPAAPAGVTPTTGNAQVSLAWPAVADATSYNVYSSSTSPVTTAGTKTTVSTPAAIVSALANATPVFAAVTAVNAGGESALSNEVCAVPTAANTTGLTLYDALCGSTLDGTKWQGPLLAFGVAGNAMVVSSQISNAESNTIDGAVYQSLATVVAGGQRVSTLKADVTVPQASASRTGTADIRAVVRITYQPPVTRLFLGGANNLDNLLLDIGLIDNGSGLQAFRNVRHCDIASCTTRSSTGIAFVDPAGFTATAGVGAVAPAAYDTKYTLTVSLNEATGVFSWTIAGGTFGAGASGTANPATYLAGNTNWAALGANPLSTTGFLSAQMGTRVADNAVAGGSAGSVSATFQNVQVGFNNGVPTLFDDFSGAGGNSGPTELSVAKWIGFGNPLGRASTALTAGSLAAHVQVTSPTTAGAANFQAITLNGSTLPNTVQADATFATCNNSIAAAAKSNRVQLQGNYYNDGTVGTTPPNTNQPASLVGDIRAFLFVDCVSNAATFMINRGTTATLLGPSLNSANNTVPMGAGNTHTLRMSWDPTTHAFTFQVDGNTVVVDPTTVNTHMTTAAPYVKAANSPQRQVVWGVFVPNSVAPSAQGATASLDLKINNVFTAP